MRRSLKAGVPVALIGDYNVVPTEFDIYPTQESATRTHCSSRKAAPPSRGSCKQGWTDAVRASIPTRAMYSFWDYMRHRWENDAGLRIDFILLTPDLAARLKAAGVDRAERGEPNTSDHAPVWAVLGDAKRVRAEGRAHGAAGKARGAHGEGNPHAPRKKRPLLVIDGDSFAHRSYHALPKTILRKGAQGRGAILGFANFLLRLYRGGAAARGAGRRGTRSRRRPTGTRHSRPTRAAASSMHAIVEQLDMLPEFVAACGFVNAKAAGYEADDFLAAAVAREEQRGGTVLVASGDRDTFQLASRRAPPSCTRSRAGEIGADRPGRGARALRRRSRAGAGFHRAARRSVRQAARRAGRRARRARHRCCANTARWRRSSRPAAIRRTPTAAAAIAISPRWIRRRRCRRCAIRPRHGTRPRRSRANGSSISWQRDWSRWQPDHTKKKRGGSPPPLSPRSKAPRYCFFIAAFTGSLTFSILSNSTLRMSLPTFSTLRI